MLHLCSPNFLWTLKLDNIYAEAWFNSMLIMWKTLFAVHHTNCGMQTKIYAIEIYFHVHMQTEAWQTKFFFFSFTSASVEHIIDWDNLICCSWGTHTTVHFMCSLQWRNCISAANVFLWIFPSAEVLTMCIIVHIQQQLGTWISQCFCTKFCVHTVLQK